ncbi:MAG TPA: CsbD family protein [Terriglobales bacterium]|nr:CsbD family protein [Terriglobales bacterium]
MDDDRIKGKLTDVGGRIERQAGEWTGDEDLQAEGTKDQAKGKAQNTWGKVKDAVRDVKDDVKDKSDPDNARKDDAA